MARTVGFFLFIGGIALLLWTGVSFLMNGTWDPLQTEAAWAGVHPAGLQFVQSGVEQYLPPDFWQGFIGPVLASGLWLVMTVTGFVMMVPALLRAR